MTGARVEVVPFAREHLPSIRRFAQRLWQRPSSDNFLQWRYLENAAFHRMHWARRGEECLAMACALERQYAVGDDDRLRFETFDWYCLPEFRASGIGVRVMRTLLKTCEAAIAVGASDEALPLLRRMGFRKVGTARTYVLPLDAEPIGRRIPLGMAKMRGPINATVRLSANLYEKVVGALATFPGRGEVSAVEEVSPDMSALCRREGVVAALPNNGMVRWLMRTPKEFGWYGLRKYVRGGRVAGWALLRVYPSNGVLHGSLPEVWIGDSDLRTAVWIVATATGELLQRGAVRIQGRTSDGTLGVAYHLCGFVPRQWVPALAWCRDRSAKGPHVFSGGENDGAFAPYAEMS